MQAPGFRYVLLIAVLLVGAALYTGLGEPRGVGLPRWPAADPIFVIDGWSVGSEQILDGGFRARSFKSRVGHTATLSVFSNQAPKLYGAGAEVPFLGNGYSVDTATGIPHKAIGEGVHAVIARRGTEQWLVMYSYGERRGLLGNGPQAWTFALFDGILGRANDYYKLFLSTRTDGQDADVERDVSELASTLFPRIASFYAS
jgi:hypothetical protein